MKNEGGIKQEDYEKIVDDFFSETGYLSSLPDLQYEYRQEQRDMALKVARSIYTGAKTIIEAPTGVGKSFAYLIPAIIFSKFFNKKVIVITDTNTLLYQLEHKDAVLISKIFSSVFKEKINITTVCGKANYLCVKRFRGYLSQLSDSLFDNKSILEIMLKIDAALLKSPYGLRDDLKMNVMQIDDVWTNINIDSQEGCLDCPHKTTDCKYYTTLVRHLSSSSVILTNHSLLLSDMKLRLDDEKMGGANSYKDFYCLPPCDRLIIDEAHNLAQNCEKILELSFSVSALNNEIAHFFNSKKETLFQALSAADNNALKKEDATALDDALLAIRRNLKDFTLTYNANLSSICKEGEREKAVDATMISDDFKQGCEELRNCTSVLTSLFNVERTDFNAVIYDMVLDIIKNISNMINALSSFVSREKIYDHETFYYLRRNKNDDGIDDFSIHASVVFAGFFLNELVYKNFDGVIWTSATLSAGDDFLHFKRFSGIVDEDTKGFILPSPYDYKHNMKQLLIKDTETGERDKSGEKYKVHASFIANALHISNGGALILFSSYRDMDGVYNYLCEEMEGSGIEILCQKSTKGNRGLSEKFRKNENSVLLGVSSFWEGVDFAGNTLRLLIIYKLPFRAIGTPVYEAQKAFLENHAESGKIFNDYELPSAIIKLKQGRGRLIRSKTDRGVVIIMDNRVLKMSYGKKIMDAINDANSEIIKMEDIHKSIGDFFKEVD